MSTDLVVPNPGSAIVGRSPRDWLRPDVEGAEFLPRHGPVIVAANQAWPTAAQWLTRITSRPVSVVVGEDRFAAPGVLGRIRSGVLGVRRRVPLEARAEATVLSAVQSLAEGGLVLIFPEGGPSPDGRLYLGHPDVAWLAVTSRVPVVPAAILPMPDNARLPRLVQSALRPRVVIGEPLDFSRYWSVPALSDHLDGIMLRAVTDQIMAEVAKLGRLTYCDHYRDEVVAEQRSHRSPRLNWRTSSDSERVDQAAIRATLAEIEAEQMVIAEAQARQRALAALQAEEVAARLHRRGAGPASAATADDVAAPARRGRRGQVQTD